MDHLLESKLQRHYKIIEFLMFKNWIPTNEVSHQTGIPDRTIQKDVGEINTYISPARIETSVKFGIRIRYEYNLNAFYVFSSLYRQSSRFQILEEVFINNYKTLNELADQLSISDSTLKRKIKRLNDELKPYEFAIDSIHMDIVGNEKKICYFYYCYFLEKYGVLDSHVSSEELQLLTDMTNEFFSFFPDLYTQEKQCFSYHNRFRTMLFIALKRNTKKHRLSESSDVKNFNLSENTCKRIHYHYGIDINKENVYHLFYVFFNRRFAWSYDDLIKKSIIYPQIDLIKVRIENCLLLIEQTEDIEIPNKEYVLLNLYNSLTYSWGNAKILYQHSEEFFVNLNNYYELFTENIKSIFQDQLCDSTLGIFFDESILHQLIFRLVTTWENLSESLENKAPIVRAALFFNTSYEHTKFLMNDITYHLKSRLSIQNLEISIISDITKNCKNFDMIITNLSVATLPHCPIVSIHANPTIDDFTAILAFYNQIIDAKVDNGLSLVKRANSIYQTT